MNLSPDLRQVVSVPTRRNHDAILDLIITNLSKYYDAPFTLPALENDADQSGKSSDHLIVLMRPLTNLNEKSETKYKTIRFRPFPDSGTRKFGQWLQPQSWQEVYLESCPTKKAAIFENALMTKIEELFPVKSLRLDKNDKPWVDAKLLQIDRKRKREYTKNKKSQKWESLNKLFLERENRLKTSYNTNIVEDLKTSNIGQWYSKLKRMSGLANHHEERIDVEEIADIPSNEQVEAIGDNFAKISNSYEPLKDEDINVPSFSNSKPHPLFQPIIVHEKIQKMRKKSSNVPGDIPWKLIREFSVEIAEPLCNILNSATLEGVWPQLWKHEYITPVPKVYPPKSVDNLRKISGTKNFSKIYEALLSSYIVDDLAASMDPSQYGNRKGLSTNHYLVLMLNKILTLLDTNNKKEK